MLCRNRALETCLKSWEEKQKLAHSQTQQITQVTCFEKTLAQDIQSYKWWLMLIVSFPLSWLTNLFFQSSQTTASNSQSNSSVPESGFPVLLTEEESRLLLGLIEVTTTLVKCVQLVTISHSSLDKGTCFLDPRILSSLCFLNHCTCIAELYELATKTTLCLESVHPGGKILEGPELRPKVTQLVSAAKDLYEEACSMLRDRGHFLVRVLQLTYQFLLRRFDFSVLNDLNYINPFIILNNLEQLLLPTFSCRKSKQLDWFTFFFKSRHFE